MLVSVIIVNYDTYALTADCIRSVQSYTRDAPYEIILVDNASPSEDPQRFANAFPDINLVRSAVNGGFAAGNNLGISQAKGNVILLLNSDTVLTEDAISKAAQFLASESGIGALTVRLRYPDGRVQHYARRFKDLQHEVLDFLRPLLYLLPYKSRAQLMLNQYYHADFNTDCDWVGGAFMMIPRAVIESLPGKKLDERYFMYSEDQLWCMQIKALGYRVACFAGTEIIHLEGGSGRSSGPRWRPAVIQRELELYRERWPRSVAYPLFAAVLWTKAAVIYVAKRVLYALRG
jgi:GT2 family glycosyltransferase